MEITAYEKALKRLDGDGQSRYVSPADGGIVYLQVGNGTIKYSRCPFPDGSVRKQSEKQLRQMLDEAMANGPIS